MFTPQFLGHLHASLSPSARGAQSNVPLELREKEDAARIARQRPCLRVATELSMVSVITDAPGRSGGEWIMKILKELVRGQIQ